MRGWGRALLLLCLAGPSTACGGDPAPGGRDGAAGLAGPDLALEWTAVPLYELGGVEATDWAAFGRVPAVAFDDRGRLHVLDADARRVTVVGVDGALVGTMGEPGDGPGGLADPSGLVVDGDGRVAVYDPPRRAFVRWGADGGVLPSVPIPPDLPGPAGPLARAGDGLVVGTRDDRVTGDDETSPLSRALVLYPDRPELDPVVVWRGWQPPVPPTRALTEEETGGFRVRLPPLVAFHPALLAAPLPGGRLAVVDSLDYRIRILSTTGPTTGPAGGSVDTTLVRPLAPQPVTPAIRERERRLRLERLVDDTPRRMISTEDGRRAAAPDDPIRRLEAARIDAMGFPDVIPVIERLASDRAGRLWIQRASARPGEVGPVDLLDASGRYLGTLPADGPGIPDAFGPDGLEARIAVDAFGATVVRVSRRPPEPAVSAADARGG